MLISSIIRKSDCRSRQSKKIKVNKNRIMRWIRELKSYSMDKNNRKANANQRSNDEE
jgi:hypothetical protein